MYHSTWSVFMTNKSKSDIKKPIHSRALLATIFCWLATLSASRVAAHYWRFRSWPASRRHVYVASASQYPS